MMFSMDFESSDIDYKILSWTMHVEDMQQETTSFMRPYVNIDDSTTENLKNSQGQLGKIIFALWLRKSFLLES